MPDEERDLLVSAVNDFSTREIEPYALKIERTGVFPELLEKLGSQGFLGMTFSEHNGGTGMSHETYARLLMEFARFSPSVAMLIALQNSVAYPILEQGGEHSALLKEVASGKSTFGVAVCSFGMPADLCGNLSVKDSKLSGVKRYVLYPGATHTLAGTDEAPESLVAVRSGFSGNASLDSLGLRGLGISSISWDSADFISIAKEKGGEILREKFLGMNREVSAILIGIAAGSIHKAIEYSKIRGTFEHLLMEYQPVAFSLSLLQGELDAMIQDLERSPSMSEEGRLSMKIRAIDLAMRASKQSIQVHGGYGYLQDFGVEKFYRDAATMSSLFMNSPKERMMLSELVYKQKAGII